MPPIPRRRDTEETKRPKKTLSEALGDCLLRMRQWEQEPPAPALPHGWSRSSRGNLTAVFGGRRVTVFERGWYYRWCVSDGERPVYSEDDWPTEDEAVEDVLRFLERDGG